MFCIFLSRNWCVVNENPHEPLLRIFVCFPVVKMMRVSWSSSTCGINVFCFCLLCLILFVIAWGGKLSPAAFSSQSFLIVWINVPHRGHLCVVLLNLSMQKGMRQQPAAQLQEKEQNKQIWKHMPLTVTLAAQMETSPTSSHYILMQMFPQKRRNVFIPNHG